MANPKLQVPSLPVISRRISEKPMLSTPGSVRTRYNARMPTPTMASAAANAATKAETCYYCHGTKLKVIGTETRDTEAAGELDFPIIEGWPNQGVGRINLDGSLGACSACHTRHAFSIEMARKPYTCKECHVGPDVPAFKVYAASKHGNIFATRHSKGFTSRNKKLMPCWLGRLACPTGQESHGPTLARQQPWMT